VREAFDTLRRFPSKELDPALSAIAEIKRDLAPPNSFSEEAFRLLNDQVWDLRVAVLGPELAKRRSPDDGKRSPVEVY
jgi:beta-N-acetylhexosaminidase